MLNQKIKWLAVVTSLLLLAHCAENGATKRNLAAESHCNPKISSALGRVIGELEARKTETAISGTQAQTKNARMNENGNIQCYVYCRRINDRTIAAIKGKCADMELVEAKSGIIQGWFSSQSIRSLAELDNIVSITLPEYGEALRQERK